MPEEKTNDFVARLAIDPRLGEIAAACEGDDFTQASAEHSLRRLHELIRDAWAACGLKVHIVSGKKASGETSDFANSIPVPTWMDDECRAVRTAMNRAKNKNKVAYYEARRHFRLLRNAKIGTWRKKWKAFWDPLSSSSDPRAVWHFIRKLLGEQRSECLCSVEEICEHFENVGKPQEDPDFCIENLREAEEWIFANASSNNADDGHHSFPQDLRFSASEVTSGFDDLKNCALGLDGTSKAIISPILIIIAPTIASFFTALLRFQCPPAIGKQLFYA